MQNFCELIMKEYTRTCFKNIRCTYVFGGAFDKEIMWKRIRKLNIMTRLEHMVQIVGCAIIHLQ